MTTTITPVWTDNIAILAMTTLAKGSVSRTTFDWSAKWGGFVFIRIGRGGTTALSSGIAVLLRRLINGVAIEHVGGAIPNVMSKIAAAISTTCAAAGNNAGVTTLTVASSASFAAGDLILVSAAAPTAADTEWCRVADIPAGGTTLLLDAPTKFAHNNVAHTVRNQADLWTVWLEGGSQYELIIDYGDPAAGDTATIEAWAQTMDSVLAT